MSCRSLVKTIIFFVNLIFSLFGLGLFVTGVLGILWMKKLNAVSHNPVLSYMAPVLLIAGTFIFFVSFSGCFGAIKEINCLLVSYVIFMLILALTKITLTIYLLLNKTTTLNTFNQYVSNTTMNGISDELHDLQYFFECCGKDGPKSYNNANITIPFTCCPLTSETKTCLIDDKDIYNEGCNEVAPHKLETVFNYSVYTSIGIVVTELVIMTAAIYLTCSNHKGDAYYEYD